MIRASSRIEKCCDIKLFYCQKNEVQFDIVLYYTAFVCFACTALPLQYNILKYMVIVFITKQQLFRTVVIIYAQ